MKSNIKIPDFIQELKPYIPGKSSDLGSFKRFKAVICSNENNIGASPAAIKAIQENANLVNFYPDPMGEKLIQKLAIHHNRTATEFILSNGLDGLLYSLFKAFTLPGDTVITSELTFIAFEKFSKMNNLKCKIVPMKEGFEFDLDSIYKSIDINTRIVYLCNPNNPTGAGISKSELIDFLDKVPSSVLVIVDEAYSEFAQHIDPDFPDTISMNYSNVLSLRTFSKVYGLAGLRIGYGVATKEIIDAISKVSLIFNPNALAQIAATVALDDVQHVLRSVTNNKFWMDKLIDLLDKKAINHVKSYANFVTTTFSSKAKASHFNNYMNENGVLLRKLDGFGFPKGVRISIGNDDEMNYVCKVLEKYKSV